MAVVEDFVEFYAARDWDRLATCFSKTGYERVGPCLLYTSRCV